MKRKISVVTGARSEFGLLQDLLVGLNRESGIALDVVITGEHLRPSNVEPIKDELLHSGVKLAGCVDMLLASDTEAAVATSIGRGIIGFTEVLTQKRPDLILLSGDRYEIFAAAIAASALSIPIAHLFGGETTEGAKDEFYRHSITKMSALHFVATEIYRHRVIQLGEHPDRVFNVGSISLDNDIRKLVMSKSELESAIGYKFRAVNFLVTIHPETLSDHGPAELTDEILSALGQFPDAGIIFTYPNADPGREEIISKIKDFVHGRPHAVVIDNLGRQRYLSCVTYCDAVVGNSSSGISEVPSFRRATVNVGDRQAGRERSISIRDCRIDREDIASVIRTVLSPEFQASLLTAVNPYHKVGSIKKITEILTNFPLAGIHKKRFFDLRLANATQYRL